MALKVKAVERLLKFTNDENDHGVYRYVLKPELYTSLDQKKVIREAALGLRKDTAWLCPDWAPCDSDFVRSLWRRSRM